MFNFKKSILIKQLTFFLVLLVIVELLLRLFDYRPGVLKNELYPVDQVINETYFSTNQDGIIHYDKKSPFLPVDHIINEQGFRSPYPFEKLFIDSLRKSSPKPVIFLIGDSYTEGCCAKPIGNSFADLLHNTDEYFILNFGVGATGPVNYKLISQHFAAQLMPDLIIVNFYLGNDIINTVRPIAPGVPNIYDIKGYLWINSTKPPYLLKEGELPYFKDHLEAYHFYLDHFTFYGDNANLFQKVIRNSILLSRPILWTKNIRAHEKWRKNQEPSEIKSADITLTLNKEMVRTADSLGIDLIFTWIPSPEDAHNQVDLKAKYQRYFEGIPIRYPKIQQFSVNDYDGMKTENHFNNAGHEKYARFLKSSIDQYFQSVD